MGPSLEEDTKTLYRMRQAHLEGKNDSDTIHIRAEQSTAQHSTAERITLYEFSGQVKEVNQMWRTCDGRTCMERTGQDKTRQDKTGQDSTGQDRTGQDRTGQDRTGQDRTLYHIIGQPEKNGAAGHLATPVPSVKFSIIQRRISLLLNSQFSFCQVQSKQLYDLAFKCCNPNWYFWVQGTMS
jgi:hypothetical protein